MVKEDMAEVEVPEDSGGCRRWEQLEMENPLWRPLMGKSRKKKKEKNGFSNDLAINMLHRSFSKLQLRMCAKRSHCFSFV